MNTVSCNSKYSTALVIFSLTTKATQRRLNTIQLHCMGSPEKAALSTHEEVYHRGPQRKCSGWQLHVIDISHAGNLRQPVSIVLNSSLQQQTAVNTHSSVYKRSGTNGFYY